MINLIPKEEKVRKVRGFYYRLFFLFLVIIDLAILIAFVAILPSYFFSAVKNNIAKSKLDEQSREPVPVPDQETLLAIKSLNNKLDLIERAEKDKFTLSTKVINAIVLNKDPLIKINDIYYEDKYQRHCSIARTLTRIPYNPRRQYPL